MTEFGNALYIVTPQSRETILQMLYGNVRGELYKGILVYRHPETVVYLYQRESFQLTGKRFGKYFSGKSGVRIEFDERGQVEIEKTRDHVFQQVAKLIDAHNCTCALELGGNEYLMMVNTPEGLLINSDTPFWTERRRALFKVPYTTESLYIEDLRS